MARQNKPQEEEEAPGAPEWMVTFSDCMTLLLTFFVLLLSFSSFDNKEFSKLQVVFNNALDSIFPLRHNSRNSLNNFEPIKYVDENNKGSEKPTDNERHTEGLLNERLSSDLNDGVVLLLPSEKMFFSSALNALSVDGKNILNDIAAYLAEMPNRVVISEISPSYNEDTEYLRLQRAWEVMNYLVSKSTSSKKIDKNRISISMSGTTLYEKEDESARMIEISLLQRSIYN